MEHRKRSDAILTMVIVACPLIKLVGYEHWEDAVGGGEQAMANTHTHIVPHDKQGGWSLRQCSEAVLTHVSVAPPLIKLVGYEHQEDTVGDGGGDTGKHTRTHPQFPS